MYVGGEFFGRHAVPWLLSHWLIGASLTQRWQRVVSFVYRGRVDKWLDTGAHLSNRLSRSIEFVVYKVKATD